ncbi:MAG TPA: class I SAM-dependent methyltransferase [Ktedonobacterales bacterium]|nr:class I SAM-dependent methyltransferase [Ktedonobacterales bacterium]
MPDFPSEAPEPSKSSGDSQSQPPTSTPNASGSLSFDRVAAIYDATRGYPPAVASEIARGMAEFGPFPPGSAVLEIGIGTGRIALPLLELGIHITGVDISPLMVDRLRAKYDKLLANASAEEVHRWGLLRVELADMTKLPFAENLFDGAVAVHVLHLVPTWRQALDEVTRVVRPGGALLIGQDITHGDAIDQTVQDEWVKIVRRLGFEPARPGAAGYSAIIAEARTRGLTVDERAITAWTSQMTPRQALESLTQREWSRTWSTPDDLFAESLRELTLWVEAHFVGALDTPRQGTHSFKVARLGIR